MKDFTKEDREQRERLERQSPSGSRLDVAGRLNRMAVASAELPGMTAYVLLRGMQARGRNVARRNAKHDRMMAAGRLNDGEGEGERLDRIHPRTIAAQELRRRYW
jgi:hypothetical protein